MHRSKKLLLNSLVVGVLLVPIFAYAQATSNQEYEGMLNTLLDSQKQAVSDAAEVQKGIIGAYLDVKTNPPTPGPNVPVTITIESYLTDLYKANISWSVDGKVTLRGTGKTSFTFQNGAGSKTTTISLVIIANTGEVVKKDFSFTPVGVTVLWEADTYTPPFYKGKAMMVPQANVRIVAISNTLDKKGSLDAGNLVYTWEKDGYVSAAASGYGKNVFSYAGPKPLTSTKVILSVSSLNDSERSDINIYVPQKQPFILFYEKDPLLGTLYNKPLGSELTLNKRELSISAEPYFFSNERGEAQSLKYSWAINNSPTQNYGRAITLRNDTDSKGSSLVSLSMRGLVQNYQTAEKKLQINFTEGGSSSVPIF